MSAIRYIRADGYLDFHLIGCAIASQSDLNIPDDFYHRPHSQSKSYLRDCLIVFLVHEETKQMRIFAATVFI